MKIEDTAHIEDRRSNMIPEPQQEIPVQEFRALPMEDFRALHKSAQRDR